MSDRPNILERMGNRQQKRIAKTLARRSRARIKAVSAVPAGSFPGVAPSPGVAPAPSPVATKSMWSDPRVLLGVAAALILFLRPKKS